nr:MAG TPA_asm: hypothetical protein [Caudoviricetes sp.]
MKKELFQSFCHVPEIALFQLVLWLAFNHLLKSHLKSLFERTF